MPEAIVPVEICLVCMKLPIFLIQINDADLTIRPEHIVKRKKYAANIRDVVHNHGGINTIKCFTVWYLRQIVPNGSCH